MSEQSTPYPRVEFLIDAFASWLKHRRELNELRQMDRGEFDRIADDLRVTPDDLNELPEMLKALGIDEAALARAEPLVLRDMERVCAMCQQKRQCDQDLAAGTAAAHYEDYCLNASTIDQLRPAPGK
jgi:uncharacterized protein YjiS (DUF1127 family)